MSARTAYRSFFCSDGFAKAAEGFVALLGHVDMKWTRKDRQHKVAFTSVEDITRPNRMDKVFATLESAGWTCNWLGIDCSAMVSPDELTHLSVSIRTEPLSLRAHWVLALTPAPYTHVIEAFRSLGFVVGLDENHEGVGRLLRVEHGRRTVYIGTEGTETGALPEYPHEVHAWRAVGTNAKDEDTDTPWVHLGGSTLAAWSRFTDDIAHWLNTAQRRPR